MLYHRFDEAQYPTTNIDLSEFRQQLEYLQRKNYEVLSMAAFRRLLDGARPFPSKAVLITIDDPYRSTYEKAYPLLREFGFPFVLFANASPLYSDSEAYMTWEMLREMHRNGVAIGIPTIIPISGNRRRGRTGLPMPPGYAGIYKGPRRHLRATELKPICWRSLLGNTTLW